MPKVSVIVPNYNHADYLVKRIDSVLNQTFQDFELILLDDLSTDDSQEILLRYKDHPKVSKVNFNSANSGSTFIQWKKGISMAKGEFIWIAESDDWAEPTFLQSLIPFFKPSVDIVYSNAHIVDPNGCFVEDWKDNKNKIFGISKWNFSHENNGEDEILNYLCTHMTITNMSSTIFRKEALVKHLGVLDGIKSIGDRLICIHILMDRNIYYHHKTLSYQRTHEQNVTKRLIANGINFRENINLYKTLKKRLDAGQEFFRVKMRNMICYRYQYYNLSNGLLVYVLFKDVDLFIRLAYIRFSAYFFERSKK